MPIVHIPSQLRGMTGTETHAASAGTVSQIIDELDRSYPGIGARLSDEIFAGDVGQRQSDVDRRRIDERRFTISVNGRDINVLGGFDTLVSDDAQVSIAPYAWYRVTCSSLANSTRWRKFIDDLRGPEDSHPPLSLAKSAAQFADPTEWLEWLGLEHEMAFYNTSKNTRWLAFVRASLGPAAQMRPRTIGASEPSATLHLWLSVALGVDPLVSTFERECRIMCTPWWINVIREFNRGDVRSTLGKKDRSKEGEGDE